VIEDSLQDEYPFGRRIAAQTALAWPEEQVDLMAVVGTTAQLDVLDRRLAPGRSRHDVVELDEASFTAAMPVDGDERASPAVPRHPDGRRFRASRERPNSFWNK
jgi:hypothetical protein